VLNRVRSYRLQELYNFIQSAINIASATEDVDAQLSVVHSTRSSNFVTALANCFEAHYKDERNIRVLSRKRKSDRKEFSVNELLFDITVCKIEKTPARSIGYELTVITGALWEIESELEDGDYREALTDFNKLVLGNSENKLFIGSSRRDNQFLLKLLARSAAYCQGNVYTALVSHPRAWRITKPAIELWHYRDQKWNMIAP
jgi:hypothetical protein